MAYLQLMGKRLSNVHICDYDHEGMLYMPLKGEFDFDSFLTGWRISSIRDQLLLRYIINAMRGWRNWKRATGG